jgi:DNA-binding GntR family transcriptional regulator
MHNIKYQRDLRDNLMKNVQKLNPPFLERIKKIYTLSDLAYEAIRDAIISGNFEPGEQLKQLPLADELEVSQRTVREALSRLVSEGLVIQKPYKGFMVVNISPTEQTEIYMIRAALEGMAIESAAKLISLEDLEKMRELLPFTASGREEESLADIRESNREFHMIPVIATGQSILIRILEQIWDITLTYYMRGGESEEGRFLSLADDLKDHNEILEALEARDGQRARSSMVNHIENNLKSLITRIEEIDK